MEINYDAASLNQPSPNTKPLGYNHTSFSNILGKVEEVVIASQNTNDVKFKKKKIKSLKKQQSELDGEEEWLNNEYRRSVNQLNQLLTVDTDSND